MPPKPAPVFYDFEASGLNGFPIEVGWAWSDGKAVISESHLIVPDPTSDIERWDDQAELVHGISISQLMTEGEPAFKVAQQLNHMLAGRELYSDSPFDEGWMLQLFEAAGIGYSFTVRRTLAPLLIDQFRVRLGISEDMGAEIIARVKERFPHTHRAEADARQWAEMWAAMARLAP